jgi:glycosyltransferase involved in cell wall biosynthesis
VNILEIYTTFLPKKGGVQYHIYDLSKYMVKKGHKVSVFTVTTDINVASVQIMDGIQVIRKYVPKPLTFSFLRYLTAIYLSFEIGKLIKKLKVNIVHAHDYLPGVWAALAIANCDRRIPLVVTFHLPIQMTTYLRPFHVMPLEALLKNLLSRIVCAIICISKFTQNETVRLKFPKFKTLVIYNWLREDIKNRHDMNLKNGEIAILRKHGINKSFILTVGRLDERQKNFLGLLLAFRELIKEGLDYQLVMVGEGPCKDYYIRLSKEINIKENVCIISNVSDDELCVLVKTCEIFVLPSRIEGINLSLLEAMSFEKLAIATKVGGTPEIIFNGLNGILVDASPQGLLSGFKRLLLLNKNSLEVMKKRARETVEQRFSFQNCKLTVLLLERVARDGNEHQ